MATDLVVLGPIDIPYLPSRTGSSKLIDKEHRAQFVASLEVDGIHRKHGCYVFALRAGQGYSPWYVGKATKSMEQECVGPYQLNQYNSVLFQGHKGTPVMFFVVLPGRKVKVPKRVCDDIETYLIQSAVKKNPRLKNSQKTGAPTWRIKGVVRAKKGKRRPEEIDFKSMMGL